MKIEIAICEDNKQDCQKLKKLLERYSGIHKVQYILRVFDSGEQFLNSQFIPDILFLDIIMNEKDGIQVGEEFVKRRENTIIIYTTSLTEKMAVAFNRIHSFGYLIKPIKEEEFDSMLEDALVQMEKNIPVEKVSFLSQNNTIIHLAVTDIFYFEYLERKIRIVTNHGNYICMKETITDIAKRMDKYGFAMSHQSFVVNLYYVDRLSAQTLYMRNGDEVFLAQKRASSFRKRLMQMAKESTSRGGSKETYETKK